MIHIQDKIFLYPIPIEDVPYIFETIDREREYLRKWLPFIGLTQDVSFMQLHVQSVIDDKQIRLKSYWK